MTGSAAKVCPGCGDTLHWLGAGYGHDKDNMAACMTLYWQGRGHHTASELLDREADAKEANRANR